MLLLLYLIIYIRLPLKMFDFMSAPTLATSLLNKFSVGRITWARASWCKIVVSEFLPLQFPEGGDFFYVALNEIGCSDV